MEAIGSAAQWVLGKVLDPLTANLLENRVASKDLSTNVEELKNELLLVQIMLKNTRGKEINYPKLEELLLQKLRDLAFDADIVLDELDYFRIQDELDGTAEAADEYAKAWAHDLVCNAYHTVKAFGQQLQLPAWSSTFARCGKRKAKETSDQDGGDADGHERKRACNNNRSVGKCLPSSSLPPVHNIVQDQPVLEKKYLKETPKLVFNRVDVSKRMKLIVKKLRPLRKEASRMLGTLGYCWNTTVPDIAQSRPTTISESTEPKLYGRDSIMGSIIYDITQGKYCGDDHLTVLPIVGPGGIGKTTLAQHIYRSQEVLKHFQVKVWTCVSLNFNVDKLTREIEKHIPKVEDENQGTAVELIGQRLKSKRFLLVLDDIWECSDEDEWKRLLLPFKKSQAKGNIIVVTTRFPAVAQMVKTSDQSIELEGLDREEYKKLFIAYVFDDKQPRKDQLMLLETGDKIMNKLKGNPLAAKTVGRLLRNHLDLNHWESVLENKEWESQEHAHDIMPALKLSYDFLPFHLQKCFSYCALFPKDYMFARQELIYFWIGLDILQYSGQNKAIEHIGLDSLNDLVSYGFFKKEVMYGLPFYLIHDLLHDLALNVAFECLSIDRSNMRSLEIGPSVRHLSIAVDPADDSDGIDFLSKLTSLKAESLQTFMISGKLDESFVVGFSGLMRKATNLRVLHLSRMSYRSDDQSMLHNLPILPHLRYLSLQDIDSKEIHLPNMLSRLYHLRILDLLNWRGSYDLLREISSLTKLRHIVTDVDIHHSEICKVGKIQSLQKLKRFEVNKESNGYELKQLGSLAELRELGIYGLERIHTKEEAEDAKLLNKKYLQKLKLDWHSEVPTKERDMEGLVLEKLQPQRHLQELCISGHGSRLCPTWLGSKLSVKSLKSLQLAGVNWEVLPSLGEMDMLHELELENMSTLKEFDPGYFGNITEHSFCSLKRLTLMGLTGLEKWVLGHHCHLFSHLEAFIIQDCPDLLGLPFTENNVYYPPTQDQDGKTHWFPNLQELEINNCPKVVSLPPIPWTRTLCYVKIDEVGSSILKSLRYSKSSRSVELEINGKDLMLSLEKVLVFGNLTDLQNLKIQSCPSLQSKDLQMLRSLISLRLEESAFVLSGSEGEVKWHIPVEYLFINKCRVTGKELTQFLSHLPKLSNLCIWYCEKILQMGVAVEQQQLAAHIPAASASAVRIEDAQATTCHQQGIAEEVEEIEKREDGLLLLPAHLSGSLQRLEIMGCHNLSLLAAYPPLLPKGHGCQTGPGGEEGGLHALRSLRELQIQCCPTLFDAYTITSFSSTPCFPFPSSLKELKLRVTWVTSWGMGSLAPISNLTSLTHLDLFLCGDDLRGEGLWPLVTQGHLSELHVVGSPKFFVGWDPTGRLQDKGQEQFLPHPCKLREVWTDDAAGFLAAPICSILSSRLTNLTLRGNDEVKVVRFTKEQEDALGLLTSLMYLEFYSFRKLQCLPACLHTLPNLKRLEILFCKLVSSLPKDGLPVSLQELSVCYCDNEKLQQQCRNFIRDHPRIKLVL